MNTVPETWIKDQSEILLQKLTQALDAVHTLPFECEWLNHELWKLSIELQKELESIMLRIWAHLKHGNLNLIEHQILVWIGQQKRSQSNIFRKYYKIHELLLEWEGNPFVQQTGFRGTWEDFLLFAMLNEANFLSKSISSEKGIDAEDFEPFAIQYLEKMHQIYLASPHTLCSDFFTLFSPFTQESVFLPLQVARNEEQIKTPEISQFIENFFMFEDSQLVAREYIELLKNNSVS